jgi:hypothetical protein
MARSKQPNSLMALFVASWAIAGVLDPLLAARGHDPSVTALPHAVLLGFLAFAWCKAHARSRGVPVPRCAPLVAGLAWPIGVPLYLVRAFPWRPALLGIAKALGVFLVCAGLYIGGWLLGGRVAA